MTYQRLFATFATQYTFGRARYDGERIQVACSKGAFKKYIQYLFYSAVQAPIQSQVWNATPIHDVYIYIYMCVCVYY